MPFLSSFCGPLRFVKTHRSYFFDATDLLFRPKTKPHQQAVKVEYTEQNSNEEEI